MFFKIFISTELLIGTTEERVGRFALKFKAALKHPWGVGVGVCDIQRTCIGQKAHIWKIENLLFNLVMLGAILSLEYAV